MRALRCKLLLFLCLLVSGSAFGQFTLVSGTVTDPNGLFYSYATITAKLVISGTPVFTSTNLPYTPPTQPVGFTSGGSFTMQLASNSALSPGGSTWTFQVCSSAGTVPPAFGNGAVCFTVTGITIAGSSQSLSSTLSAAAPALTAAFGGSSTGCTIASSTANAVVFLNGSTNCTSSSQFTFIPQTGGNPTIATITNPTSGATAGDDLKLATGSTEVDLWGGLTTANDSTVAPKSGTLQITGGTSAGTWLGGGANGEVVLSGDFSSLSRASNVVTAVCTCFFTVGAAVNVSGVTDSSYNGNFTVLTSVPSGSLNQLTWAQAGSNSSTSGGHIGLATLHYNFFADAGPLNLSSYGVGLFGQSTTDAKGNPAGMLFMVAGTSAISSTAGGPISFYAGDSGAGAGFPGGDINLTAGSSRGAANNNGGNINLTPGSGTGSGTAGAVVFKSITGSIQCLHVNSAGALSGTGSDCGSGTGAVSSVSGTSGVSVSPTTGAVVASLVNPVNQTLEDNGTGGTTATPGQVFNILSFGADPTGSSTIDTALSNAVASCVAHTFTGGCIIYFPPGRYLISSAGYVLSANSVTLMGANRGSTITQAAPTVGTAEYMIQNIGTNNRITGMTLAGQSTQATDNTTYQYCIENNAGSSFEVDNNIFTGTTPGTNGCNVAFFDMVGSTGTQFVLNNIAAPTIGTTGSKGYGVLLSGSEGAITNNVSVFSATQGRHHIYLSQSTAGSATYYVISNNNLISGTNVQIECNASDTGGQPPVMYNIIDSNELVSTAFTNGSADTGAIDMNANCKFNKVTNNKITTPAQAGISLTGDSATTETGSPWTITGSCVRTNNVDVITSTGIGANLLPGQWITVSGTTGGAGVPATCNGSQFLVTSTTANTVSFTQYGTNTTTTAAAGTVTYNPARAEDNQISGNKITLPGATGIVCGACSRDAIENNTIYDAGTSGTYKHGIWLAALNTGQVGASFNRVTGNKVSGPNYFDNPLVIDAGSVVTSSTNYVDGNYFPSGNSGSILDNGTGGATVYGTNYVNGANAINGVLGGALESYPNAVTVSGSNIIYTGADLCAAVEAAIAANGSGHVYNARGFTGNQVCLQSRAYGNTSVMLYGGAAIGTEVDGTLLLSSSLNLYIDGVATFFTDGVSNYGTPAIIVPWGFKIEYNSPIGHFVSPCTGTNTPVTGCTTAFPVRSFSVTSTSYNAGTHTLTGTTSGIVNSGGPGNNQNLYVKELAALTSPSCVSNNLLRTIQTIPGATSFTIAAPSGTANCASTGTLYLVTPMFGYGLQNSGVGYEPVSAGQQAFGTQLKNVNVDLLSVLGLVGIQNVNQGEQASVDGFYCRHPAMGCLQVSGGANDSGPYDNIYMQTLAVTTNVNPTTFAIHNSAATAGYRRLTANVAASLNGTAFEPNACVYNDGNGVAFTGEFHCEGPVDLFETGMDNNVGAMHVSVSLSAPSANPNVNQVHVVNDGFTVSGTIFEMVGTQPSGGTNAILDDQNTVTITDSALTFYSLTNNGTPVYISGNGNVTATGGLNGNNLNITGTNCVAGALPLATGQGCLAAGATQGVFVPTRTNTTSAVAAITEQQTGDCASPTTITGSGSTATVQWSDAVGCTIRHDFAGSAGATLTIPTPTTLNNSHPFFTYCNDSTHADTLTPTTFTIRLNGSSAAASQTAAATSCYKLTLDPTNSSVWTANSFSGTAGGVTSVNTLTGAVVIEAATAGQMAVSGGSGAALTGAADMTYSTHTFATTANGIFDWSAATGTNSLKFPAVVGGTLLAGTSTANLSAPIVLKNTNSTNNNTSITLGVTAPGTSTGQTVLNVNGASTGSDLIDWGTGGTWTNGVLSSQTLLGGVKISGAGYFGVAPTSGIQTFGTAGGVGAAEGTAPTNVASYAAAYPDSTTHEWEATTNGGSIFGVINRTQPAPANETGKTATDSAKAICTASAGGCNVAGQYTVFLNVWGSGTACSSVTAGSVVFTITWVDEQGTTHTAVPMAPFYDFKSAAVNATGTFNFNTSLATEGASVAMVISTNGSAAPTVTGTYTACTTGTGTFNFRAAMTRLQ